jgi:hypothetical protein
MQLMHAASRSVAGGALSAEQAQRALSASIIGALSGPAAAPS